jgi:hypothetical protein
MMVLLQSVSQSHQLPGRALTAYGRQYLQSHPEFTPESLVEQIRAEVLETTKVSVSAGIAPNAKVCAHDAPQQPPFLAINLSRSPKSPPTKTSPTDNS